LSTPIFRVLFGAVDITVAVQSRLLSLSVQDHAGIEADSFILRLADDKPRIPLPAPEETVSIEMGYAETGLFPMGTFTINEIEISVDPAWEMRVHGESIDMLSTVPTTRSEAWQAVTLGAIVTTIAARNGWTPAIFPELAGRFYDHIDQMNTSDMHFLTNLARDNAAVFKVTNDICIFAVRGDEESVTGRAITRVFVTPEDNVLGLRALFHRRGHHKQIISCSYNYDLAATIPNAVPGPGDNPDRTLSRRYPNVNEATWAALSESNRLRASSGRLTLSLIGRPELRAEGTVELQGFRDPVEGPWKVKSVEHELSKDVYRTTVEGEIPQNAPAGVFPDLPRTPAPVPGGVQGPQQ
jgi:hypothetical protein